MHKKFETNRTKIKGGCQSGRNVVTHDSKSDEGRAKKRFNFTVYENTTVKSFELWYQLNTFKWPVEPDVED